MPVGTLSPLGRVTTGNEEEEDVPKALLFIDCKASAIVMVLRVALVSLGGGGGDVRVVGCVLFLHTGDVYFWKNVGM